MLTREGEHFHFQAGFCHLGRKKWADAMASAPDRNEI